MGGRPAMTACLAALLMGLGLVGCVSRGRECPYDACGSTSPVTELRLGEARDAQEKYRELFQRAGTVEEAKSAEMEIERLGKQIADLETRAAVERRGRQEPRTIIYGPLGFVLNVTERTLQKLYILDVR